MDRTTHLNHLDAEAARAFKVAQASVEAAYAAAESVRDDPEKFMATWDASKEAYIIAYKAWTKAAWAAAAAAADDRTLRAAEDKVVAAVALCARLGLTGPGAFAVRGADGCCTVWASFVAGEGLDAAKAVYRSPGVVPETAWRHITELAWVEAWTG